MLRHKTQAHNRIGTSSCSVLITPQIDRPGINFTEACTYLPTVTAGHPSSGRLDGGFSPIVSEDVVDLASKCLYRSILVRGNSVISSGGNLKIASFYFFVHY